MKFMGKCFCAIRNKSNIITTAIFLAQFFYDLIICDRPKVHCEFISSVRSNDPIKKKYTFVYNDDSVVCFSKGTYVFLFFHFSVFFSF